MKTIGRDEYLGAREAGFSCAFDDLICEGERAFFEEGEWVISAEDGDREEVCGGEAHRALDRLWDFIGSMAD